MSEITTGGTITVTGTDEPTADEILERAENERWLRTRLLVKLTHQYDMPPIHIPVEDPAVKP